MINFLQGAKAAPRLQLRYVFDFSVRLKHHQVVLRHDQVDINHLLSHLTRLFALLSQLELHFLLAGEDATFRIGEPDEHVIIKSEMESTQLSNLVFLRLRLLRNCTLDETWNLQNDFVKVHRGLHSV